MSSLIFGQTVLDFGTIVEEPTRWIGKMEYCKAGFPGAYLIDEEPPYQSQWNYQDGTFIDETAIQEAQALREAEYAAESAQSLYEAQAYQVRKKRDALLFESDWTQGKDISDSISAPWAIYRQQLRDVTDQPGFPFDVVWPEKPQIT